MRARLLRASIPLLLLLLGIGAVGYGFVGHTIAVVLKPEVPAEGADEADPDESDDAEPEEPEPMPPPVDPWAKPPGDPWAQGPGDPWAQPAGGNPFADPGEEAESPDESDEPADGQPDEKKLDTAEESGEKIVYDPEPAIILDVTVGGLALSEAGEIVRTYAAGGKPPSLCPT